MNTVDCPYCDCEIETDDWIECVDGDDSNWIEECPCCGKDFNAVANIEITYSVGKAIPDVFETHEYVCYKCEHVFEAKDSRENLYGDRVMCPNCDSGIPCSYPLKYSMIVHKGTEHCLLVRENIKEWSDKIQKFSVVNGEWTGKYYDGQIIMDKDINLGYWMDVDVYNDINTDYDNYGELIHDFITFTLNKEKSEGE